MSSAHNAITAEAEIAIIVRKLKTFDGIKKKDMSIHQQEVQVALFTRMMELSGDPLLMYEDAGMRKLKLQHRTRLVDQLWSLDIDFEVSAMVFYDTHYANVARTTDKSVDLPTMLQRVKDNIKRVLPVPLEDEEV